MKFYAANFTIVYFFSLSSLKQWDLGFYQLWKLKCAHNNFGSHAISKPKEYCGFSRQIQNFACALRKMYANSNNSCIPIRQPMISTGLDPQIKAQFHQLWLTMLMDCNIDREQERCLWQSMKNAKHKHIDCNDRKYACSEQKFLKSHIKQKFCKGREIINLYELLFKNSF